MEDKYIDAIIDIAVSDKPKITRKREIKTILVKNKNEYNKKHGKFVPITKQLGIIAESVANFYGVHVDDFIVYGRKKPYVTYKHIYYYFACKLASAATVVDVANSTLSTHSNVIVCRNNIAKDIQLYSKFREEIEFLEGVIMDLLKKHMLETNK